MKTVFGMLRSFLVGKDSLAQCAKRVMEDFADCSNEFERGRMVGRAEAFRSVERRIIDELDPKAYREIVSDDVPDREDMDEPLRTTILRKWARCETDAQRDRVFSEIFAARHEIRAELLYNEPEMRGAIWALTNQLDSIEKGTTTYADLDITGYQCEPKGSQREVPLVGLAGYIATLAILRAEMRSRAHAELAGWHICEHRAIDAMDARKMKARPIEGFTGYIKPVDKRSVDCRICGAKAGDPCIQPKREA